MITNEVGYEHGKRYGNERVYRGPEMAHRERTPVTVHGEQSFEAEQKKITVRKEENHRGMVLRIIEEVNGRRNQVVVPLVGASELVGAISTVSGM